MSHRKWLTEQIIGLIPHGSRVLDLGCGNGDVLSKLKSSKQINGYGIDCNFDSILSCIKHGLNVFQGNIDEGLKEFSDGTFDYVILSQTLQQVRRPTFVMSEMLRVGKYAIIIFPNFAYWKNRLQFMLGKSPRTPELPYHWHNTPNIRVVTINDFYSMCKKKKYVTQQIIPGNWLSKLLNRWSNFFSPVGMFVVCKESGIKQ
ncbi:methionine biosynthesis protein MetW [bacterium]|nr:methionine biosynthesis protein MetW [bacterium]